MGFFAAYPALRAKLSSKRRFFSILGRAPWVAVPKKEKPGRFVQKAFCFNPGCTRNSVTSVLCHSSFVIRHSSPIFNYL